jgi:hypothetical protein
MTTPEYEAWAREHDRKASRRELVILYVWWAVALALFGVYVFGVPSWLR